MHLTSHNVMGLGAPREYTIEVLIVGGGEGGFSNSWDGVWVTQGGGGGQVKTASRTVTRGTSLSAIIGAGGNVSAGTASSFGGESAAAGYQYGYSGSGKAPGAARTPASMGGGGGDATAGRDAGGGVGGQGGDGTASPFSGVSTYYGGGAGGSGYSVNGAHGLGGGGSANTGGGGFNVGGSGIVIVRYPGTAAKGSGGTVTISGGYVIHTFTSSGTFTA